MGQFSAHISFVLVIFVKSSKLKFPNHLPHARTEYFGCNISPFLVVYTHHVPDYNDHEEVSGAEKEETTGEEAKVEDINSATKSLSSCYLYNQSSCAS
jgi:hypothetical protein